MKTKKIPVPENWKDLKPHPLSTLAPYGQGIDTVALAARMRQHGYDDRESIVLFEDKILDGRHRHIGAQEADVIPTFSVFIDDDPVEFVAGKIARQHLTESQRAMFVAKKIQAAAEYEGATISPSVKEAAAEADVSDRTMKDANKVAAEGGAKLQEQVASGQVPVNVAAGVTRSVFCERCGRVGPVKGCKKCQELRAKTTLAKYKTAKKPKAKPIGSEKVDWKAIDKAFGVVVRGVEEVRKAYGGDRYKKCRAALSAFHKMFSEWKKAATAS